MAFAAYGLTLRKLNEEINYVVMGTDVSYRRDHRRNIRVRRYCGYRCVDCADIVCRISNRILCLATDRTASAAGVIDRVHIFHITYRY